MKKKLCPCGSNQTYKDCCGVIHLKPKLARHPEQLMRARYTAHTQNNISFIFNSWHPSTRPESSEPVEEWNSQCSWLALNVAQSRKVGTKGFVEFVALYRQAGQLKQHHEEANFRFEKGQWWYMNQST